MNYGLEDRVSPVHPVIVGFQEALAMIVGAITPTLVISRVLELPGADTASSVSEN